MIFPIWLGYKHFSNMDEWLYLMFCPVLWVRYLTSLNENCFYLLACKILASPKFYCVTVLSTWYFTLEYELSFSIMVKHLCMRWWLMSSLDTSYIIHGIQLLQKCLHYHLYTTIFLDQRLKITSSKSFLRSYWWALHNCKYKALPNIKKTLHLKISNSSNKNG